MCSLFLFHSRRNSGDRPSSIETARENVETGVSRLLDNVEKRAVDTSSLPVSPRVDDLHSAPMGFSVNANNEDAESETKRILMDTSPSEQVATVVSYSPDDVPVDDTKVPGLF